MLTPTLLDVSAMIGLPPTGVTYDPDRENEAQFQLGTMAYGAFTHEYFDKKTTKSMMKSTLLF